MTRTAAIYVRISDDRQGAGLGVDRQEKDCRVLADRLGWQVSEVYVDNDLTAFNKSRKAKPRPAYDRMKADLVSGRVNAVVAWHTDRLHRTPRELEDFIDVCEKASVPVETVHAGVIDLRTPSGRAVARTLCAWAYYESEHKGERIRAKYVQIAEAGQVGNGGYRPFGYAKDRMTVVEDEAKVLRDVYAQVISGRSLRSITHWLNDNGHYTTTGRPWSQQGLRYNLLSPRNAGWREHRRVVVARAVWPPIVDEDTWQQVGAILRGNKNLGAGPARKYLLTGFLQCGRCGCKMIPRVSQGKVRFGCRPKGDGGCGGIVCAYPDTEKLVLDLLMDRLERDARLEAAPPPDLTAELLARIADDEQKLKDLAAAFADDPDANPLELRAAGARIRARIAQTRTLIRQTAVVQMIARPLVVRDEWPSYDLAQQRAVVGTLIERIRVNPARPSNRFDPTRLDITWR